MSLSISFWGVVFVVGDDGVSAHEAVRDPSPAVEGLRARVGADLAVVAYYGGAPYRRSTVDC